MKCILTKYQYQILLSEAKGDDNIIKFDNNVISAFQKVVNTMMKQKYQWFEDIQINYLSYMSPMRYMGIEGVISVDMEWGSKQWREFHYSQYFPGNYYFQTGEETDSVSFGDIIGSDLGNEIREIFILALKMITGIFEIKTLSWSWLMTKFVENPENDDLVTEEISDIKKVKAMDKVLQNEYPNQYTDEHAGSTLVLTNKKNAYNMKLQEELVSIKNKMGLTESDDSDFIEKYEKDLKLAKKLIPQLIKLIKDNFGDDLYKIDYRIKGVAFGSTWIKNEKTGSSQSYSSEKVLFTLEFINKNYAEKREIRHKFFNIIESFTPFNITAYGSPIDVDFFNYTREEF